MIRPRAIQTAWLGASLPRARALRHALRDPERAQRLVLSRYLRANADTAFGLRYGFASIRSAAAYQESIPLTEFDEYAPWIDRIRAGETRVLTRAPVERLVPTSGSTAAAKLIPYTSVLRAEFARGVSAWIADLYRNHPALLGGLGYWSITPAIPLDVETASRVPVGFENDSAYVGRILGRAVAATLAVNPVVQQISDIETFRYATALELMRTRELRFISVWHPSFLTLLFETMERHWEELVQDVRSGHPSVELSNAVRGALTTRGKHRRADELAACGPGSWTDVWPNLSLVSCWGDAHAESAFDALASSLPDVEMQPKGLLATEAFITLPFSSGRPVAALSHFFEFIDNTDHPRLLHELVEGEEYSLVVTTGGGLYRYQMRDRVRVVGFVEQTPSLRFIGKEDRLSDRFGEKLDDGFVARVLGERLPPPVHFAMLAPDERSTEIGYTLYLQAPNAAPGALEREIDAGLAQNPHYRYCRKLGQLGPLRIFMVRSAGHSSYIMHCVARGQRLGDIKPASLSAETGWSQRFDGAYANGNAAMTRRSSLQRLQNSVS
jgi:hypothetical protein